MNFPGYSIICEIGRGGMATVYRARQDMLDREVALKVLNPTLATDAANAQRFLQEARMLASLEHPHVVPVFDVGVTPDGSHYFSMQLLENSDFTSRLQRGVSEAELVRVLTAVADALGYAHARGYVHRDVTPSNILFDADDKPRLTDFGIARAMAVTSRITAMGLSVGTSHYMSPEQARGNEVDPRSDIYSLGVVCYEALTGKPPFNGEDSFAVAYAHVYEPVPPLPVSQAKWQPLIDRCMAKDPDDRFQDCGQFIASMRRIVFASRGADARAEVRPRPSAPTVMEPVIPETVAAETVVEAPPVEPEGRPAEEPVGDSRETHVRKLPALVDVDAEDDGADAPRRRLPGWLTAVAAVLVLAAVGWWQFGDDLRSTGLYDFVQLTPETPDTEAGLFAGAANGESVTLPDGVLPADINGNDDPVPILLERAQQNFNARRYTTPADNNALDHYRLVLRLDPENREARKGVERIAQVYIALADQQMEEADPSTWARNLDRADDVARQFGLSDVSAAVDERREGRLDQVLRDAEAATAVWDAPTAIRLYELALGLSPDSARAKDGLAQARRIGQPGFVFRDRISGSSGPAMVIVGQLAYSQAPITRGEFLRYWSTAGVEKFGAELPACRDREKKALLSRSRGGVGNMLEPGFPQADNHPVVCITAAMADDYADWLSRNSGKRYRVPSGADLERAGLSMTGQCGGANIRDAAYKTEFGGQDNAACNDGHPATSPVTAFATSRNGLRDVGGNVSLWTTDCVGALIKCRSRRVLGASWASPVESKPELSFPSDNASNTIGFRVVREIH